MCTTDFSWGKGGRCVGWQPTTRVVPKVGKIRGLNLPGTPRATSAFRGIPLLYFYFICRLAKPKQQSVHVHSRGEWYAFRIFNKVLTVTIAFWLYPAFWLNQLTKWWVNRCCSAFAEILICSSFFRDIAPRRWVMGAQCFPTAWYRGDDKSLGRPGRKQATATEDFEFHISYLQS
jgi:hypothetical protein